MVVLLLLLPVFLFSGEFTATLTQNLGEMITLNLILKDAAPKGNPSLELLDPLFSIQSQGQSSNTRIINGNFSSSTSWKLTLVPKVKGELEIPSISINTSEGTLSTQSLKVHRNNETKANGEFQLTAEVSNENPYKNQPFFYTLKLSSKYDLTNLQVEKLEIEDAIVEVAKTKELKFVITPLKSGPLKIPSLRVQGEVLEQELHDPFARMWGIDRLKPFALSTEAKIIAIKAPLAEPWLPATALQLEELWDVTQVLQEGEPITWGFKISALGLKSTHLPRLTPVSSAFKIYADKPETGDEIKEDTIHSYSKEYFTLIPSSSGDLLLPEVSIQWWDVNKNQMVTEKLPQRTLHIIPAIEKPKSEVHAEPQIVVVERDVTLLYSVIGVLTLLFLGTVTWLMILQRKLRHLKENSEEFKPPKKEKLPDLNPT